jgi:hypothetical protein
MRTGTVDKWIAGIGGSMCLMLTAVVLMGQASAPMTEKMATASGTIASVDPRQKALTLQTDFAMHEFAVESDTKISDGQKAVKLDQLQPGAEVTVEYAQIGEKLVARFITLDAAGRSAGAAPGGTSVPGTGAPPAANIRPPAAQPSAMPAAPAQPEASPAAGEAPAQGTAGAAAPGGAQHPDIKY